MFGITATPSSPKASILTPAPRTTRRAAPIEVLPVEPLPEPAPAPDRLPGADPYPSPSLSPSLSPSPSPYQLPTPSPDQSPYPDRSTAPAPLPTLLPTPLPTPTPAAQLAPSTAPQPSAPPSQRAELSGRVAPPTAFELEIENERKSGRRVAPHEPDPVDNVVRSVRRIFE